MDDLFSSNTIFAFNSAFSAFNSAAYSFLIFSTTSVKSAFTELNAEFIVFPAAVPRNTFL